MRQLYRSFDTLEDASRMSDLDSESVDERVETQDDSQSENDNAVHVEEDELTDRKASADEDGDADDDDEDEEEDEEEEEDDDDDEGADGSDSAGDASEEVAAGKPLEPDDGLRAGYDRPLSTLETYSLLGNIKACMTGMGITEDLLSPIAPKILERDDALQNVAYMAKESPGKEGAGESSQVSYFSAFCMCAATQVDQWDLGHSQNRYGNCGLKQLAPYQGALPTAGKAEQRAALTRIGTDVLCGSKNLLGWHVTVPGYCADDAGDAPDAKLMTVDEMLAASADRLAKNASELTRDDWHNAAVLVRPGKDGAKVEPSAVMRYASVHKVQCTLGTYVEFLRAQRASVASKKIANKKMLARHLANIDALIAQSGAFRERSDNEETLEKLRGLRAPHDRADEAVITLYLYRMYSEPAWVKTDIFDFITTSPKAKNPEERASKNIKYLQGTNRLQQLIHFSGALCSADKVAGTYCLSAPIVPDSVVKALAEGKGATANAKSGGGVKRKASETTAPPSPKAKKSNAPQSSKAKKSDAPSEKAKESDAPSEKASNGASAKAPASEAPKKPKKKVRISEPGEQANGDHLSAIGAQKVDLTEESAPPSAEHEGVEPPKKKAKTKKAKATPAKEESAKAPVAASAEQANGPVVAPERSAKEQQFFENVVEAMRKYNAAPHPLEKLLAPSINEYSGEPLEKMSKACKAEIRSAVMVLKYVKLDHLLEERLSAEQASKPSAEESDADGEQPEVTLF